MFGNTVTSSMKRNVGALLGRPEGRQVGRALGSQPADCIFNPPRAILDGILGLWTGNDRLQGCLHIENELRASFLF
jgi:hypothetical protein